MSDFRKDEQATYRNNKVGFVWQMHYLLPEFTTIENVMLPKLIAGSGFSEARSRAQELLMEVGLEKAGTRRAGELSGGEQQRVALARALANRPALLLADEPTGNLDPRSAERVMDMLERLHREHALTTVVATHNPDLAQRAQRVFRITGGRLSVVSKTKDGTE